MKSSPFVTSIDSVQALSASKDSGRIFQQPPKGSRYGQTVLTPILQEARMRNTRDSFVHVSMISFFVMLINFFPGAPVFSQEPVYKGKTLTIIQGREPGGSGDMRARAVAPFLQKHIPGNPTVLFEYMPGGGGAQGGESYC